MRNILFTSVLTVFLLSGHAQIKINTWTTDPNNNIFFKSSNGPTLTRAAAKSSAINSSEAVISVDPDKKYQEIDGFGWALTGGSAQLIMRMAPAARAALLKDLIATSESHIGGSYIRVSIGASDLNDHVFSYDDIEGGKPDTTLAGFDLGPDKKEVIPVLKEMLAINPKITILASPWSAPTWMKTNNDTRGGSLKPEYYKVYARYLVKYIESMRKAGIRIDAITVQNEPLHPGNNPSMFMPANEQAEFIRSALGPAFRDAGLTTKIIIYDHNCDKPEYPMSILDDPGARKYVDGSAFHLYGGEITALSKVHEAFPTKNLYFTEQWVGAPGNMKKDIAEHIQKLIIGATRNWSRNVIEWNLAADPQSQPHTDRGGCDRCLGAVTIDGEKITKNPAYYIIAHAAKFVRPGSERIESTESATLPNVAFRAPGGKIVLIVLNTTEQDQPFSIRYRSDLTHATLAAGAVATYVW